MGNVDPKMAQKMLDSLSTEESSRSEYWRMKHQLLKIRIDDKNYRPVTSDVQVKEVVDYFENHGNSLERQEALYYAGSTYRDLKDHPLSLHYYLEAMELCEGEEPYDTLLLRSTYSNLSYQYDMVQDYVNAEIMCRKEYLLAIEMGQLDALSVMQLAENLSRINKNTEAEEKFVEAYKLLDRTDSVYRRSVVSSLLGHFSHHKMKEYADKCFELAQQEWDFSALEPIDYTGLAKYYLLSGMPDSAIYYYKARCDKNMDLLHQHESNKNLLRIYYGLGNMKEAAHYGMLFAQCSDSLNLGERQRLAATVNNAFQYQHEKMEEEALVRKEESHRRMMNLMFYVIAGLVVSFLFFFLYYLYQKNRNLARQNAMLKKLQAAEEKAGEMEVHVREIVERNRKMSMFANQNELAEKAEQVVNKMYDALKEKRTLSKEEWDEFYTAMDAIHPQFKENMITRPDNLKPGKLKVGYLMLAGLQNAQIRVLTKLPKTTVWRWIRELEWIRKNS